MFSVFFSDFQADIPAQGVCSTAIPAYSSRSVKEGDP